jgi:Secretion system C-terminal sorting domain
MQMNLHKIFMISIWLMGALQLYGQTGTYTVQGSLTMTSTSKTEIQLGSLTDFDKIAVTGSGNTLTLAGPLTVLLDGYTPNNADKFEIASFPGTTPTGTFSSVAYPGGMSTWMIDYGVLFPGKVTIYGPQALPVTWTSFDGRSTERGNVLRWQTATEVNSDYFIVQYSGDGAQFTDVAKIAAAGSSSTSKTYSYLHTAQSTGVSYYRLRQVDYDGTEGYSKVIAVDKGDQSGGEVVIYPNPTSGMIHFNTPVADAEVYDNGGRIVKKIISSTTTLDLMDLVPGSYNLKLNNGKQVQSIIINR